MDEITHSRLTTAATLIIGGMAAGHLLMPYSATAGGGARAAFWGAVLAIGALRGWRDAVVREAGGRAIGWRVALTALGAALLALAGYAAMHGAPSARS